MTEESRKTLFGQSPKRYGLASLIAVCLAFACWPLMFVVGFIMVYVAMLLALIAVVSGLLGIGSGIYYNEWLGVVTGVLGVGLAGFGVCSVVWAVTSLIWTSWFRCPTLAELWGLIRCCWETSIRSGPCETGRLNCSRNTGR